MMNGSNNDSNEMKYKGKKKRKEQIPLRHVFIVHSGVRKEMNFVHLSHDKVTFQC